MTGLTSKAASMESRSGRSSALRIPQRRLRSAAASTPRATCGPTPTPTSSARWRAPYRSRWTTECCTSSRCSRRILGFVDLKTWLSAKVPDPRVSGVPFQTLTADFKGRDGDFYSDDLLLRGPVMNISALGHMRLGDGNVDMQVGMVPFKTGQLADGQSAADWRRAVRRSLCRSLLPRDRSAQPSAVSFPSR